MPRWSFINKMERENADYRTGAGPASRTVWQGRRAADVSDRQRARLLPAWSSCSRQAPTSAARRRGQVPAEAADRSTSQREALIESACELDDELINKYLEGEELTADEIRGAIRRALSVGSSSRCSAAARRPEGH